ncbi:MAG: flagellar motor protein MotB [Sulfurimonas sp.]|jgi:flagellar motor protein MotB
MLDKDTKFTYHDNIDYVFRYFNLHAEQRLKTFHFYIIIITLLLGAIITLAKLNVTIYIIPIAGLMTFFSFIFWKLDIRNKELIRNAEKELKKLEKEIGITLFLNEEGTNTDLTDEINKMKFGKRYKFSKIFELVFSTLGIIGVIIIISVLVSLFELNQTCELFKNIDIKKLSSTLVTILSALFITISIFMLYLFFSKRIYRIKFSWKSFAKVIFLFVSTILVLFYILDFKTVIQLKNHTQTEKEKVVAAIDKKTVYFNQGQILFTEYLSDKSYLKDKHFKNVKELYNILDKLNTDKNYYIKVIGYASKEKIDIKNDNVSDNYQLSKARADSVREFIINILLNDNFPIDKIKIDIYGNSNEYSQSKVYSLDRKVEIFIYEY